MTEAYTSLPNTIKFYNYGADVPFNFKFITDVNANSNATAFKSIIDNWMKLMPKTGVANWVVCNHTFVNQSELICPTLFWKITFACEAYAILHTRTSENDIFPQMGNHDRVRIATRYPNRADQMTMLAMILPGVAVTYYGEEIGMEDNSTLFLYDFRDGCRTPFQWNDSINAGE